MKKGCYSIKILRVLFTFKPQWNHIISQSHSKISRCEMSSFYAQKEFVPGYQGTPLVLVTYLAIIKCKRALMLLS